MNDNPDRLRWDARYRDAAGPGNACRVLRENLHLLPARGRALDLACGTGGNALLLAERGLDTEAWDISPVGLAVLQRTAAARSLAITTREVDLAHATLPRAAFDLIVVSRFLERALCPAIADALRPGGLLFYQTFTRERVGEGGPKNPEWRLARGELLRLFADLEPVVYREEGLLGDTSQGFRDEAMLVARRLAPA